MSEVCLVEKAAPDGGPYRIAFLMLDDIHHIHHILPIALELSSRPQFACKIYFQAHSLALSQKMAADFPQHRCQFETVTGSFFTRLKCRLRQKRIPSGRIIRHLSSQLINFDIVVSPDLDIQALVDQYQSLTRRPLFFLTLHGLGDRPMASFAKHMSYFDLVFVGGNKYLKRLVNEGVVTAEKCALIGYTKFDIIPREKPRLFKDDKPVVIYNPHFTPEVSSWWKWGEDILEYFYHQQEYNFIFAPHTNLFNRKLRKNALARKYLQADHLLVDLGSEKSVDMTYIQAADIYLGDCSSQVYEFIRTPRPCLFLNPHGVDWQNQPHGHYSFWQMGPVFEQLQELWKYLQHGVDHSRYFEIQKTLFDETFSITSEPACLRVAKTIENYLRIDIEQKTAT